MAGTIGSGTLGSGTMALPAEAVSGYEWAPEPWEVSALLTARTFDSSSFERGEFSSETRPTVQQVEVLIDKAANEVVARLGAEPSGTSQIAFARELVAIRAAMQVELAFFPEQLNSEQSAYEHLRDLFESGMTALIAAQPDTATTRKGIYSLRMRSEVGGGLLSTAEQLP